jgi:hypothetical protein
MGAEPSGREIVLGSGKIAWELCALAQLLPSKTTIRAVKRLPVLQVFLTKVTVLIRTVPYCSIFLIVGISVH